MKKLCGLLAVMALAASVHGADNQQRDPNPQKDPDVQRGYDRHQKEYKERQKQPDVPPFEVKKSHEGYPDNNPKNN
jgi:hypothetical protein